MLLNAACKQVNLPLSGSRLAFAFIMHYTMNHTFEQDTDDLIVWNCHIKKNKQDQIITILTKMPYVIIFSRNHNFQSLVS